LELSLAVECELLAVADSPESLWMPQSPCLWLWPAVAEEDRQAPLPLETLVAVVESEMHQQQAPMRVDQEPLPLVGPHLSMHFVRLPVLPELLISEVMVQVPVSTVAVAVEATSVAVVADAKL
jgi:hypothetical protein